MTPPGQGVCGTAAARRETVLVPDVHQFSGHIVCDSASHSEIVVPLLNAGRLLGVLDLDSPKLGRFDAADQTGLERLIEVYVAGIDSLIASRVVRHEFAGQTVDGIGPVGNMGDLFIAVEEHFGSRTFHFERPRRDQYLTALVYLRCDCSRSCCQCRDLPATGVRENLRHRRTRWRNSRHTGCGCDPSGHSPPLRL